jgi:hypothetical protein
VPLRGQGVLIIWRTVTSEADEDALRWHNTEHMAERCAVPGFLRGRRYVAVSSPRHYLDLYETETVETIRSAPYLARLDEPTPWTRRLVPHFRGTYRVGCRVIASAGRGLAGATLTVRIRPMAGRGDELRAWLAGPARSALRDLAAVTATHLLETVPETTRIPTAEGELRGATSGTPADPWPLVLLVEANDPEALESLAGGPLHPVRLADHGAEPGAAVAGVYRLQLAMDPE